MFEWMLGTPSEKLKAFARGTLILETIGSIVGGIILCVDVDVFAGLGTVIGGILVAWFTALIVEGFALIVANSENKEATPTTSQQQDSAFQNAVIKETQRPAGVNYNGSWNCTCGRKNFSYVSTCTCGKNKREVIMEQANKQN